MGVGGQGYRPRFEALERLFDKIAGGGLGRGATLHGCHLAPAPRRLQAFGSQTLVMARESSRKSGKLSMRQPLRHRVKFLNVLLAGNALETPYLIIAGRMAPAAMKLPCGSSIVGGF